MIIQQAALWLLASAALVGILRILIPFLITSTAIDTITNQMTGNFTPVVTHVPKSGETILSYGLLLLVLVAPLIFIFMSLRRRNRPQ